MHKANPHTGETLRQGHKRRWATLSNERSPVLTQWRELSDYIYPSSGRFALQDKNKSGKRTSGALIDTTSTYSADVLASGMVAGMTSPARPWFRVSSGNRELDDRAPVKLWLNQVATIIRDVLNRSNAYGSLHMMYEELGAFGTSTAIVTEDFENIVHFDALPIGEYCLAQDARNRVNTVYREFEYTAEQLVTEFGKKNVSQRVCDMMERQQYDQLVRVMHVIEPRTTRNPNSRLATDMAYSSVYFEVAGTEEKLLRESGFRRFTALCPRWRVRSGDPYGGSPGKTALGHIKQLQHAHVRKGQAIDYQTKPPLQVPHGLANRQVDMLPGGLTFVDQTSANHAIRSLWEVKLDTGDLREDIQDMRAQISRAFFTDLFLMLANSDRTQMTAREVAERHEEKLLMLGPVVERLKDELLSPLIDIIFDALVRANVLPDAPEDLRGSELKIEFVSMLAQAQRAVGIQSVDRLIGTVSAIGQVRPDAWDKLDIDEIIDQYGDMLGADPSIIVPTEDAMKVRAQRAADQQKAAMAQQAPAAAQTAKDFATASQTDPAATQNVVDMFTGYNLNV